MSNHAVACLLLFLAVKWGTIEAISNNVHEESESAYTLSSGDLDYNWEITVAGQTAEAQGISPSDVMSSKRMRRNIFLETSSTNFAISDLFVSQRCKGMLLEWKPPPIPMTSTGDYRNFEFLYYNVYRSTDYFTDVTNMKPIASGLKYASLRNASHLSWFDRNPATNTPVWYAVSVFTATGKEYREVSPAQVTFVGAFGPSGPRIPLVPRYIHGRILNHAVAFNKQGNRYLIVYDVDTNSDSKPERIYAVQIDALKGAIIGNPIDISANIKGQQGWPEVAYNSISNQYIIVYRVITPQLAGGQPCLVAQRVKSVITQKIDNPQLILQANTIVNGKKVFVPLDNHKVEFNPATGGYVTLSEVVENVSQRSIVMQILDANLKSIRVQRIYHAKINARNSNIFVDSRRNELYIASLLPAKNINNRKFSEKYVYTVTKLNGTLHPPVKGMTHLIAGTSNFIFSTLTGFYSEKKDRLCLYWTTINPNKHSMRYAEVAITGKENIEGERQNYADHHIGCKSDSRQRKLSAAEFNVNGAQLLVWEEVQSMKWKINGELIKDGAFQFKGQQQKNPIVVSNSNNNIGLVVWQELVTAGQINVYAQHIKPVPHRCASGCATNEVCLKENTCIQPTSSDPCAVNNGGCSHKCLLSGSDNELSAVCECPFGMKLTAQNKACIEKRVSPPVYSMFIGSLNLIWHMTYYQDASVTFKTLPVRFQSIVAMAYDSNSKKLYFSDVDAKVIMRCDLNGDNYDNVLSGIFADGLAIDSERRRIYWTDVQAKAVETMKLDGSDRNVLINTNIEKPRAIKLVVKNNKLYLYWSDWGTVAKIEQVLLDASGSRVIQRKTILSSDLLWPNAIAMKDNLLYIGDAGKDKIESLDIMTNAKRRLAKSLHPYDIQIKNDSIFWSDWQGMIFKANTFQIPFKPEQLVFNLKRPTGFIIVDKIAASKLCRDPGTPVNGQRLSTGLTSGSKFAFACDTHFILDGNPSITCLDNGKWSGPMPKCLAEGCSQPKKQNNGNLYVTGVMVGDAIVHTCNPGYKMIGSKVRRCQANGKWSGDTVKCFVLPVFTKRPQNHTIAVGKSVVLRCDASGESLKVQWMKNEQPLTSKDSDLRVFIFEKSIVLSEVRFSDAATFTCKVSNQAGTISAAAVIKVLGNKNTKCGKRKFTTRQRISGGRIAGEGSHPWIAMLFDNRKKEMFCAGSLISERWILTAAHCFEGVVSPNEFVVILGKSHRLKVDPNQQTMNVKAIYKHSDFSAKTYDSDIALLQLEKDALITDYVIPICLPYDDLDFKLADTFTLVTIAGWGSKNEKQLSNQKLAKKLREMEIPVVGHSECQSKMVHPVTKNMICAGDRSGTDACKGDSGGPMEGLNYKTNKHVIMGVVSWGDGCGKTDSYGVYTRVKNYLAWINTQTSKT